MKRQKKALGAEAFLALQYLSAQAAGLAPLQTSGSGNGQDSWAAQSNTPSAGETSISDFMPGPSSVQVGCPDPMPHRESVRRPALSVCMPVLLKLPVERTACHWLGAMPCVLSMHQK